MAMIVAIRQLSLIFGAVALLSACGTSNDFPGPCSAQSPEPFANTITWHYDDNDRVVEIDSTGAYGETVTFTYTGTKLTSVRHDPKNPLNGNLDHTTYTFGDTVKSQSILTVPADATGDGIPFMREQLVTYDPERFRFMGHPNHLNYDDLPADAMLTNQIYIWECVTLDDPDCVVRLVNDITYSYDGPARVGTQIRTGSDGSSLTFQYDAEGRLLKQESANDFQGWTYEYSGSRLISAIEHEEHDDYRWTYEYDDSGNLTRSNSGRSSLDLDTEYNYDCW